MKINCINCKLLKLLLISKGESIIASSSTGLYNIGLDDEAEQICNLTGIKHFVIRRDFVYFVSKIEG